jgi:hypothetical protein
MRVKYQTYFYGSLISTLYKLAWLLECGEAKLDIARCAAVRMSRDRISTQQLNDEPSSDRKDFCEGDIPTKICTCAKN